MDALLDRGWISFADNGKLLIPKVLPAPESERLGGRAGLVFAGLKSVHRLNLAFHRARVFRDPA